MTQVKAVLTICRMASFRKVGKRWRAELYCRGLRQSRTFTTKAAASEWAREAESAMRDGIVESHASLADAIDRYIREVSPKHKGARWEEIRLNALKAFRMADKRLSNISPSDLASWRDKRLQEVSAGTVRREMGLLGSVFEIAMREWLWLKRNPMKSVKKPATPPPRERILTDDEIRILADELSGQYRTIFLLALETGMRLGEICGIRSVDIYADFVRLHNTKNGTSRDVPLSTKARELITEAPFSTTAANASAVFYKARKACGIDCTFHDTRHTACTRLAKVLTPFELARMLGHKSLTMTLRYYNETASEIAGKLG